MQHVCFLFHSTSMPWIRLGDLQTQGWHLVKDKFLQLSSWHDGDRLLYELRQRRGTGEPERSKTKYPISKWNVPWAEMFGTAMNGEWNEKKRARSVKVSGRPPSHVKITPLSKKDRNSVIFWLCVAKVEEKQCMQPNLTVLCAYVYIYLFILM